MSSRSRRRVPAVLAAAVLASGAAVAVAPSVSASPSETASYRVTFTNLTRGQWLTPPNVAVHEPWADVFQVGRPASTGVREVAENGAVAVLAAELTAALDATGRGASTVGGSGPLAPGATVSFELTAPRGSRRLSLVSMIICTNDGFGGVDGRPLPRQVGSTRTYKVNAFDAGSEVNTEADADLVPAPFCLGPEFGSATSNPALAEGGVVRHHRGIEGVGDLDESFAWDGPVANVTVERTT